MSVSLCERGVRRPALPWRLLWPQDSVSDPWEPTEDMCPRTDDVSATLRSFWYSDSVRGSVCSESGSWKLLPLTPSAATEKSIVTSWCWMRSWYCSRSRMIHFSMYLACIRVVQLANVLHKCLLATVCSCARSDESFKSEFWTLVKKWGLRRFKVAQIWFYNDRARFRQEFPSTLYCSSLVVLGVTSSLNKTCSRQRSFMKWSELLLNKWSRLRYISTSYLWSTFGITARSIPWALRAPLTFSQTFNVSFQRAKKYLNRFMILTEMVVRKWTEWPGCVFVRIFMNGHSLKEQNVPFHQCEDTWLPWRPKICVTMETETRPSWPKFPRNYVRLLRYRRRLIAVQGEGEGEAEALHIRITH